MAISSWMMAALKTLSYADIDVKENYRLARALHKLVHPTPKLRGQVWDHAVTVNGYELTVRVFKPKELRSRELLLFFHGGGWVTGSVESYTKTCADLSNFTNRRVLSLNYRLAPEFPFPFALEDCYQVTKALHRFTHSGEIPDMARDSGVNAADIRPGDPVTLIGDSAGGNLAAAVSLLAAERGEFQVARQILLYPLTHNDHSENTPFPSVLENGTGFLLTSKRVNDYIELYIRDDADRASPYLAPLLSDNLRGQPQTLIITAEYDPLRDEGEAYGQKLRLFGNRASVVRMTDTLHGFFSLPFRFQKVRRCYSIINAFLNGRTFDDFALDESLKIKH